MHDVTELRSGTYVDTIHICLFCQDVLIPQFLFFGFFFLVFCLFRAALAAYGGCHAGGRIRAVATGLHQSHSNIRSKLRLRPTTQLTATPDL